MISHWAHPNAHPGVGRHTGVLTATRLSVPVVFLSIKIGGKRAMKRYRLRRLERASLALVATLTIGLGLFAVPVRAASATYTQQVEKLAPIFSNWCLSAQGEIVTSSQNEVVCDQSDKGTQAAFFEALRGSNGPRRVRTRFILVPEVPGTTLVQATRSYVYQNAIGNTIETSLTSKTVEQDLRFVLRSFGGD